MIEVQGLTKHYGDVEALRGISFRVEAGEVIQAVKLTKHLYDLSTTDAKAFVDDLSA